MLTDRLCTQRMFSDPAGESEKVQIFARWPDTSQHGVSRDHRSKSASMALFRSWASGHDVYSGDASPAKAPTQP